MAAPAMDVMRQIQRKSTKQSGEPVESSKGVPQTSDVSLAMTSVGQHRPAAIAPMLSRSGNQAARKINDDMIQPFECTVVPLDKSRGEYAHFEAILAMVYLIFADIPRDSTTTRPATMIAFFVLYQYIFSIKWAELVNILNVTANRFKIPTTVNLAG